MTLTENAEEYPVPQYKTHSIAGVQGQAGLQGDLDSKTPNKQETTT